MRRARILLLCSICQLLLISRSLKMDSSRSLTLVAVRRGIRCGNHFLFQEYEVEVCLFRRTLVRVQPRKREQKQQRFNWKTRHKMRCTLYFTKPVPRSEGLQRSRRAGPPTRRRASRKENEKSGM